MLYDVNQEQLIRTIVFTASILLFVSCLVYSIIVKPIIESNRKKGAEV